jgi:cation:H+ antiporter
MSAAWSLGQVAIGVVLLGGGADLLVRGATALARLARVSPAIIGLTIVAMGTSLPELTVGVSSAVRGASDIGIGNVLGVNVFNICVVLGITALVQPIRVHGNVVRLEWPVMFFAALQCLLLVRDGQLDRLEGGVFVVALVLFTLFVIRVAARDLGHEEAADLEAEVHIKTFAGRLRRVGPSLGLLAIGIALLLGGGQILLGGALNLAELAGLSERVIGLTVVSMGTGLPEVAASVAAARRGQSEMALGNVIGSNIVNIFGILGTVAIIRPLAVDAEALTHDVWWMVAVSFLLLPIIRRGFVINRIEGGLLLATYGAFLATLKP